MGFEPTVGKPTPVFKTGTFGRSVIPPGTTLLRACVLFGECTWSDDRHHHVVAYSSDLADAQWNFLEPLLLISSKRGPKHGNDLRHVVDAMLYISHTGCQWRFLPEEFGPWTRVWSQYRRWSSSALRHGSGAQP